MASVVRGGPLLNGCDGMRDGWEGAVEEQVVVIQEYIPERIHESATLRQLRKWVATHSTFTLREVQALGIPKSTASYRLMQMAKLGELVVHKSVSGGRTSALWFERHERVTGRA